MLQSNGYILNYLVLLMTVLIFFFEMILISLYLWLNYPISNSISNQTNKTILKTSPI